MKKMNYLLNLFDEHQPRRIRVIENLLKSRRTVSNLFWAQQYGLLEWQGAYRNLNRDHYETVLAQFQQAGLLIMNEGQAQLTSQGVVAQEELRSDCYQPSFLSWYWITNTKTLEARFLLGVQVVSELTYHHRRYVPITAALDQQRIIKHWLRQYSGSLAQLSHQFYQEVLTICQTLASEDPRAATLLTAILPGAGTSGASLGMLRQLLQVDADQVEFIKHDSLLAVAAYAAHTNGVLHLLLSDLLAAGPLSRTVSQSLRMLQHGKQVNEIGRLRHLKVNTIREHLLEAAIVQPTAMDWTTLIPEKQQDQLANQYHGRPSTWQYVGPQHDPVSFFYYRLWQIIQGENNHD